MSRSNIRSLMFVLIVTLVTFVGSIFLVIKGVFFIEFMGLKIIYWAQLLLGISIAVVILYDFISIRVKRKKYGELKYRLKRKDKSKQILAMVLILIIYSIQLAILTNGFKKINSEIIFVMYCIAPLPLLFANHNIEKEGLKLKEIIDLPSHNEMYLAGEREKCVY